MGGLDEISAAIGGLQAEAKSAERSRAVIYTKLDEVQKAVASLAATVAESNAAVTTEVRQTKSEVSSLKTTIDDIVPEVETWRTLRNKAIGGLFVAGLFSAGSGAAAWEAIKAWFKGG